MKEYDIIAENLVSGELATVRIVADHERSAQVEALHLLFHSRGWRRVRAYPPASRAHLDHAA